VPGKLKARYRFRSGLLVFREALYGVADGARTHDNRNHNLDQQPNSHEACSLIRGKFSPFLNRKFSGFC